MTSQWPRWRLKSPASRLFTQSFIQAQIKENIKAPRHWPLCGEFTGTGEFPAKRASNAENVSIWWRHHAKELCTWFVFHCTVEWLGLVMMTSTNGNIFHVTGHLCGEFTGDKGQWRRASMFSLICVWINNWVNNREAGDLRGYRAHHDVTVTVALDLPHSLQSFFTATGVIIWSQKTAEKIRNCEPYIQWNRCIACMIISCVGSGMTFLYLTNDILRYSDESFLWNENGYNSMVQLSNHVFNNDFNLCPCIPHFGTNTVNLGKQLILGPCC